MAHNTHQKTKQKQYDKYNEPGGFKYYRELEKAATELTVGGQCFADASTSIRSITDDSLREHNLDGLEALEKWKSRRKARHFFAVPSAVYKSPSGTLAVKIQPQFGLVEKDGRKIVAVWNSAAPKLARVVAASAPT